MLQLSTPKEQAMWIAGVRSLPSWGINQGNGSGRRVCEIRPPILKRVLGEQRWLEEPRSRGPFVLDTFLLSLQTYSPPFSAAWEPDVHGPYQQAPLASGFLWDWLMERPCNESEGTSPYWGSQLLQVTLCGRVPLHSSHWGGNANVSPRLLAWGNHTQYALWLP